MEFKFRVVGLRVLLRVVENCVGNYQFEPVIQDEYEVLLEQRTYCGENKEHVSEVATKLVLNLSDESGMCGSGYTTACWSAQDMKIVRDHGPMTHVTFGDSFSRSRDIVMEMEDLTSLPETYSCALFSWSGVGNDPYYPSGGVGVTLDYFRQTFRGHTMSSRERKPMVHVFLGNSGLGKSTLGLQLLSYDTDCSEEFKPSMAYAQVIVLGNKWPEQTLTGIRSFFGDLKLDVNIVPVRFGKSINFDDDEE